MKILTTTDDINNLIDNYHKGFPLPRTKKIFFRGQEGTLNEDVSIARTHEEMNEYVKCSNDIFYFIEKYCSITLRKYQKEWINGFINNRFLIYMTSRQTGYSNIMACVYLHYLIFNNSKSILLISNKLCTSVEFIKKLFNNYLRLPYFLKLGINVKSQKRIVFNNGSRISLISKTNGSLSHSVDLLSYLEMAYIPNIEKQWRNIFPAVSANSGSRIILQSQPNGYNLFYKLVSDSGKPNGNAFYNVYRTYWWEVEGRDEKWKQEQIKMIGQESFDREYDLMEKLPGGFTLFY